MQSKTSTNYRVSCTVKQIWITLHKYL